MDTQLLCSQHKFKQRGYSMQTSTIVAISTPSGKGGIGIVRLSGPQSVEIASKLFYPYSKKPIIEMKGYTSALGEIREGENILDEGILSRFVAPKSYTGEDVIEISCHGGSLVLSRLVRYCLEQGAQPAQAGEFTRRAFVNGKLDLTQAEAVMDLIGAQNEYSLTMANNLRKGKLSTKMDQLVENLMEILTHLAAWADYPEEDIEEVEINSLTQRLEDIDHQMSHLLTGYDTGQMIKNGIPTAIIGRPNVGKSTFMNRLLGYERSIVTEIPGTTRDIVSETMQLGDVTLHLYDTAGIRETEDLVEQIGVSYAKQQIEQAGLIFALFDYSSALSQEDEEVLSELGGKPLVILVNKSDLDKKIDTQTLLEYTPYLVEISAKEGKGLEQLEEIVKDITEWTQLSADGMVLANERQRLDLLNAQAEIKEAQQAIISGITLDAVTVCLESAMEYLLSLTGKSASEEVIDQVFARFCIGK